MADYCAAKGYPIAQVVKEIGSGVNDARPKLLKLLTDPTFTLIVLEHKDRLTRFGFNRPSGIKQLLKMLGRRIEVIRLNNGVAENGKEDLVHALRAVLPASSPAFVRDCMDNAALSALHTASPSAAWLN